MYFVWLGFMILSQPKPTVNYGKLDNGTNSTERIETSSKNVATIIENGPIDKLVPLLHHFGAVLGPEWPIVLFTNQTDIPYSASLHRVMKSGQITIRSLPADVHFEKQQDVSAFLKKSWFWEQLAPAEHVLMFQADSILCSASSLTVDDFLHYDLIGARLDDDKGLGGKHRGGLSLRSRTAMLDVITRSGRATGSLAEPEDQWFYNKLSELPPNPEGLPRVQLPTTEVANIFAVGSVWYDQPLGFHSVEELKLDGTWIRDLEKWCPEYKLALPEGS